MRRILNFLLTVLVLFVASHYFPACVRADSFGWLLLAAALIWVVAIEVAKLFIALAVVGGCCGSITWIVLSIIGVSFSGIIAILLLSKWLPGFWVSGFWTALLLSLVISAISISEPEDCDN